MESTTRLPPPPRLLATLFPARAAVCAAGLVVRESGRGSRGVFAAAALPAGTVLLREVCAASVALPVAATGVLAALADDDALRTSVAVAMHLAQAAPDADAVSASLCPLAGSDLAAAVAAARGADVARGAAAMRPAVGRSDAFCRALIAKVQLNSFALRGRCALARRASMLNHSAAPNACHMPAWRAAGDASAIEVRAVRDIAAGEEVCIAYVSLLSPPSESAAALREMYFFDCGDARAQMEAVLRPERAAAFATLRRAALAAAPPTCDDACRAWIALLAAQRSERVVHEDHHALLDARTRLARLLLDGGGRRAAKALPVALAALATCDRLLPPNWPALLQPLVLALEAARAAGDAACAARLTRRIVAARAVNGV